MIPTIPHWIDGREHEGDDTRHGDVTNPATGEVTASVAFAGPAEVTAAVTAAAAAASRWAETSLSARTQVMFRFRELLNQRKEELADLITGEHGKVRSDALGEVTRGQEVVDSPAASRTS